MTGILGGTFDPPQNGHLALARAALARLPIDRLLVLVAADPGHRTTVADAENRLRLAQTAFEGLGEVEQSGGACHTGRRSCFYRAVPLGKAGAIALTPGEDRVFDPKTVYGKP